MKRIANILWSLLACLLPLGIWAQTDTQTIKLTFNGIGNSKKISSILVENLSQPGEHLRLNGDEILVLGDHATGIEQENAEKGGNLTEPLLYPNPAFGDGNLVFDVLQDGEVDICISTLDGKVVDANRVPVVAGRNAIRIPAQGFGFYIVQAKGNGIDFAQKWMCNAEASYSGIQHNGVQDIELPQAKINDTRADAPVMEYLKFKPGDLLKFTGMSGKRTNIVLQKPVVDHTVTFQFFNCKDANGYNYPTVEIGGLLWMAEDLRMVDDKEIKVAQNAQEWADGKSGEARAAYADYNKKNAETGAYYTPQAAPKALPELWSLPTADELKALARALGGMDVAGSSMKMHGEEASWKNAVEGLDEVQLNLDANGYLAPDGQFMDGTEAAFLVSRSRKGQLYDIMQINDGSDAAVMERDSKLEAGRGYTIRGVRPAISLYREFLQKWTEMKGTAAVADTPDNSADSTKAPLGDFYRMNEVDTISNLIVNGQLFKDYKPYRTFGENRTPQIHHALAQKMPDGLNRYIRVYPVYTNQNNSKDSTIADGYLNIEVFGNLGDGKDFKQDYSLKDMDFKIKLPAYRKSEGTITMGDNGMYTISYDEQGQAERYRESYQVLCEDFNKDGTDDILIGQPRGFVLLNGKDYTTVLDTLNLTDYEGTKGSGSFCYATFRHHDNSPLLCVMAEKNNKIALYGYSSYYNSNEDKVDFEYPSFRYGNVASVTEGLNIGFGFDEDPNRLEIYCHQTNNKEKSYVTKYTFYGNYQEDFYNDQASPYELENPRKKIGNMNAASIKLRGANEAPYLFANGSFYKIWSNSFEYITSIPSDRDVCSGSFIVGNFDGNDEGRETIRILTSKPELKEENGEHQIVATYRIDEYYYDESSLEIKSREINTLEGMSDFIGTVPELNSTGSSKIKVENYIFPSMMPFKYGDFDRDLKLDRIEHTYSEPRIQALLAAAPYWKDEMNSYQELPATLWGDATAAPASTNNARVMMAYEHEFNAQMFTKPIQGITGEEFILQTIKENGIQMEQTADAVNVATSKEDMVILQVTPFTSYVYSVVKAEDDAEIGEELCIHVPEAPCNLIISLDEYMKLRAGSLSLPNLKELFQHTPGDPLSYKESFVDAMPAYGTVLWGNGDRQGWQQTSADVQTSELAVTEEMASSQENRFEMDTELTLPDTYERLGVGTGRNVLNATSHEEKAGHKASGKVMGGKQNFQWNICRMNVEFGGQKFPVVTYIVQQ